MIVGTNRSTICKPISHCKQQKVAISKVASQTVTNSKVQDSKIKAPQQSLLLQTLGVCAGNMLLCGFAHASSALVVESEQTNSLPYFLLVGALLAFGAVNGFFTVMKTAVDKSTENQLLGKALARHKSFVATSSESSNAQNPSSSKTANQTENAQSIESNNRAKSLQTQFKQGLGKSGIAQWSYDEPPKEFGRAYQSFTQPSQPVVYTNQIIAQNVMEYMTYYTLQNVFVPWNEDRSLAPHVLQAEFQKNFGKVGACAWGRKEATEKVPGAEYSRAYSTETQASEPVSEQTHYQYVVSRDEAQYQQQQQQDLLQNSKYDLGEQQLSFLAQMALEASRQVEEMKTEDRSISAHVMQSEFSGTVGRTGSVAHKVKQQNKLEQLQQVQRAYAVETVTSAPVSVEAEQQKVEETKSKNPIIRLLQAIINFFKWLLSLIFGKGDSGSNKPVAA
eukprot:TRINITY_DN817_c0_g1_i1.p1 TRINITY_DN817_c0_g1~~TRINITY_DN817_c0_g1_i1.p1  ORF type:complete len:448 (-),score=53.06 TRINITY_DN817_c0_g1_i1:299-1642(-)